ncbi:Acyl-CoA synthetase (AMP-forming)/AMP-acid ligase II [Jatrophihabitans endophyticus]|uniref:Acyl-CoA synthetase (AMP-forming)/AMP-acid ligase II n=1 Tax=Jatrophihabitans endophyticus TaxID=1206085 RepID=A0A1M5RE60_9ACTN|nr:AMP-binding protein [Jatrophihabitans endophyticus]SHH24642.1 Acyl-CoA synthetase (AMP-forming)/AMP-acid ligase II [Jatrophihabitans endophyticus]
MHLLSWLDEPADDRGVHLYDPDTGWRLRSYAELAAEVHRVAARLRATGARPGDVVSLVLSAPWSFVTAFWGTVAAGMVPSPLASPLTFGGLEHYVPHLAAVFATGEPAVVLTDDALADVVATAVAASRCAPQVTRLESDGAGVGDGAADTRVTPRAPGELALLQFTSGSTGAPKGVRISRAALEANVAAIRGWLGWRDEDVFASWLPLYHDMGLIGGMVTPIASGTELWLLTPDQFVRSPLVWLECFGRHGATLTTSPSFGYGYTARRVRPDDLAGLDFSRWRVAILGAERIDPAAVAAFHRLVGPHGFDPDALVGAYGLAEVTLAASGTPPRSGVRLVRTATTALAVGEPVTIGDVGRLGVDDVHGAGWMTSCGVALDGLAARIVDDDGAELPEGVFGEIELTGDSLADGYLVNGDDGPRAVSFGASGLRTGDSGFVDDGELFVVGRLGESMKVRGASIHAEDVELELAELDGVPRVRSGVAFGFLDGAHVAAVFVEGDEIDPRWVEAATARVRVLTARTAEPVVLRGARGAIARTSSGKPRRRTMWSEFVTADPKWTAAHGRVPQA